uniref:Putative organic cation/carnitine transporter n=1 Tax=Ixodes ricinus TaxID=34613 RepID=A0A131XV00_IXORI
MNFERVLREIGGFGFFNKTIMVGTLMLGTWHTTMCYFFHLFILIAPPSQWCFLNDTSSTFVDMSSLPRGKCMMMVSSPDGGYSNVTFLNEDRVTCPTGWKYDNEEYFTTLTMENQWLCGDSRKMYAVHTAFWAGSMTGYLLSGFLADRIGRKKTILMLVAVGVTGNFLGIFLTDFITYAVLRFLAGIGAYTVCTTVFVVVVEYTVSDRRTLISFIWAMSWTIMAAVLPWYGYLLQSWRMLVATNIGVDVLLVIALWWVPESSSWLLAVNRTKEALTILQRIARSNGIEMSQEHLEKLLQLGPTPGTELGAATERKNMSFTESTLVILKSPRIRKITILIYLSWFVVTLCYNASTLQLGRLGLNLYSTYSIAIAFEFPVNVICILSLDRLGRRWPNVTFMFFAGAACLLMGFLRTESEVWTLVMAVVAIVMYAGTYNITYQLATEIFPTVIRGRIVLLQRLLGDIGGLMGAQVASLAEYDTYAPFLVMGGLSMIATVMLFLLPDTMNQALPQSIEEGENFALDQTLCFCPLFPSGQLESKKQKTLPITEQAADNNAFVIDEPVSAISFERRRSDFNVPPSSSRFGDC